MPFTVTDCTVTTNSITITFSDQARGPNSAKWRNRTLYSVRSWISPHFQSSLQDPMPPVQLARSLHVETTTS